MRQKQTNAPFIHVQHLTAAKRIHCALHSLYLFQSIRIYHPFYCSSCAAHPSHISSRLPFSMSSTAIARTEDEAKVKRTMSAMVTALYRLINIESIFFSSRRETHEKKAIGS